MSEELPRIKFSRKYKKLKDGGFGVVKRARLLEVLDVRLEELSPELIQYDTQYSFNEFYRLPAEGEYLMLIFEKALFGGEIFTTLRRSTPWKREYYRGLIGRTFEVVVPEVKITAGYSGEEGARESD